MGEKGDIVKQQTGRLWTEWVIFISFDPQALFTYSPGYDEGAWSLEIMSCSFQTDIFKEPKTKERCYRIIIFSGFCRVKERFISHHLNSVGRLGVGIQGSLWTSVIDSTCPCGTIEHSLSIYSTMVLLGLEVDCFLIFWEITVLISKAAVQVCIPISNSGVFPLPHILSSISCHYCFWSWPF